MPEVRRITLPLRALVPGRITFGPLEGEDDLDQLAVTHARTYNAKADEAWIRRAPKEIVRVIRRGRTVVGGLVTIPGGQWFGGRSVPQVGIGGVGIDPAERATGLGVELMRRTLEELYEHGHAISSLYPATQTVYRRVGYELAGTWTVYSVDASKIDIPRDRSLDVERVGADELDQLRTAYTTRARASSGHLDRSDYFWRERILGSNFGDPHAYVVRRDDAVEGYCVFDQSGSDRPIPYDLRMRDLVALTPAAARRLWTFFADHRSFARDVRWAGAPTDPAFFGFGDPVWKTADSWSWMLRLVDAGKALACRGYPAGLSAELHLDVVDEVLPWNAGRLVLSVADGAADVRKGGRGRMRVDVRGLAALFTGFAGARELAATGLVEGPDTVLRLADAAFAGPAPWLPDFF